MTFQEGMYLCLAALGALTLLPGLWCIKRDGERLRAFSMLHAALGDGPGTGRRLLGLLFASGVLVAAALALAGPLQDDGEGDQRREGMDLVFAVDTSRSMLAIEGGETRLDRAVREAASFLDHAGGDRVGLVAFAGAASTVCPLTRDLGGLEAFLNRLDVYAVDEGGSSLSQGIEGAVERFEAGTERQRVVVLISDGEDLDRKPGPGEDRGEGNRGGGDPVAAASKAREEGIAVHTLMVGQADGARIALDDGFLLDEGGAPVRSKPDPTLMRRIASAGGGAFVDAGEAAFAMDLLYGEHLSGLYRPSLGGVGAAAGKPDFQGFLLLALVLFLLELFLPRRREVDLRGGAVRRAAAALLAVLLAALPGLGADETEGYGSAREGVAHYREGAFVPARAAFERALAMRPEQPELLLDLGLTHLALEELDLAASCFDRAIASGKVQVVLPARFGAGLAACRRAEKALDTAGEMDRPAGERSGESPGRHGEAALKVALDHARSARRSFVACLEHGFWPGEAAVNLEEANRLGDKAEKALAALRSDGAGEAGADRKGREGTGGAAQRNGEGGAGERTASGDRVPEGMGEAEGEALGRSPSPITEEAKARIYAVLEGMEKTRTALERARVKLYRKRSGGRDW